MSTGLLFPDEAKPALKPGSDQTKSDSAADASAFVAEVAVPIPVDNPFTYSIPIDLEGKVAAGARVSVPFGPRRLLGVVVEVRARKANESPKMKPISALVEAKPVLPAELLAFLREVASYYLAPLGEVISLALPAVERKTMKKLREAGALPDKARVAPSRVERWVVAIEGAEIEEKSRLGDAARALFAKVCASKEARVSDLSDTWANAADIARKLAQKGLVTIDERVAERAAFDEPEARDVPPELTDEQAAAVAAITAAISVASADAQPKTPFLLQGVTGSGKTEVYLRAIETALALGRGALMLVPEIALTPQLVGRFRARFGDGLAVIHSALDPSSRHDMWRRLHAGDVRVAIGARSALFAPVPDLGLVVVDEEHDASFKQEEGVRYNARDCAILRAHRARAACVLGSATPSLEMVDLARRGRATRLTLSKRARMQPLPKVEVIDLRRVGPGPTGSRLVSLPLHRAIEATLAANEQAILFLNRRGFAPAVRCEACGTVRNCPDCDVALTYHRKPGVRAKRGGELETLPAGLRCHYCDRVENLPPRCAACGGALALEGIGTERLEDTLAQAFPRARVARLDRDVASGRDAEAILRKMRARDLDILVGTQMVAKGHDLPFVTLVGVVNADAALSMPDFRASERTFQLLVQVAGRAGRGDAPGTVIIQTRDPEHAAITCAKDHDVEGFLAREIGDRNELGYPPFSRLALARLDGKNEKQTLETARALADSAWETDEVRSGKVDLRGPTPAPIARVRERFRYRVMLRGARPDVRTVARVMQKIAEKAPSAVRITLDIDPLSML